jgi:putative phosphoribosyl transferase
MELTSEYEGREEVAIPVGRDAFGRTAFLSGNLVTPTGAKGIVAFAHGSGSSRHSPRNQYVARQLRHSGLGTLVFDLLTADEQLEDARTQTLRFDIALMGRRMGNATAWLADLAHPAARRIGCFGASTGAAAALVAAAQQPDLVAAVVSRGGRPDLAGKHLAKVVAPTLLIVGAEDSEVLELNRQALEAMPDGTDKELSIVADATHLFEEPGTLERAAELSARWFAAKLARVS